MSKVKEFNFLGRDCKAASPPFSEEACELVELFEESQICREEKRPFRKNGRMIRLIRSVGKNCLVRGGHTAKEAEEIVLSIDLDDDAETGIPAFVKALGLG